MPTNASQGQHAPATIEPALAHLPAARVVIADDHDLARAGLRSLLSGAMGVSVVGEARTGAEAVQLCTALQPELALLDVRMPALDGLAATRALRTAAPATRVLLVSMYDDPAYRREATEAGAAAYLLKDASQRALLSAVRRVLRGERLLAAAPPPPLRRRRQRPPASGPPALTPREEQVLRLLAAGATNRAIATTLRISVGTVKVHVEHLLAKLGATDRTQAAVLALQYGLLTGEAGTMDARASHGA
jgi:DNA-binding NarL/FixJ family response regulator